MVGFLWGFVAYFLALYLSDINIPTAYFYSVSAATLFFSHFTLMKKAQMLPKSKGVALGFFLITADNAFLLVATTFWVVLGAILFGIGYYFAFPLLST